MRRLLLSLVVVFGFEAFGTKPVRAYDVDCAIMLCMAGGFPSSAVCAAAYAEMIRRITPWPARSPFGICTYAAVPVELGGQGGEGALDISTPEYAWLRQTRVYWFAGGRSSGDDGDDEWSWSLRICDHENNNCRSSVRVVGSPSPWPRKFLSENSQLIEYPTSGYLSFNRAVLIEFGDFQGKMGHSDWVGY